MVFPLCLKWFPVPVGFEHGPVTLQYIHSAAPLNLCTLSITKKTRGPWATSLTWVTLAHMKIFFEFKYTFHFLLPHLTLWSIDFNKLAMYYVRKLSCKFQLILTRVSQSPPWASSYILVYTDVPLEWGTFSTSQIYQWGAIFIKLLYQWVDIFACHYINGC